MRFSVSSGLLDSRLHAVPQNISLELRKHGHHSGERSAARGRQVERFAKGTRIPRRVRSVPGACSPGPPATAPSDPAARPGHNRSPAVGPLRLASPAGGVSWPRTPRLEPRRRRPNGASLHSPASPRAAGAVSSGRGWKLERRARLGAVSPLSKNPLAVGGRNTPCFQGVGHAITVCPKTIVYSHGTAQQRGRSRYGWTPMS